MPASPQVVLITGASSGIGWATAERLARDGFLTILVARRGDRLDELRSRIVAAGGEAIALVADLGREADRQRVIEDANAATGHVDILINNAGVGWYGYASDMPWTVAHQMLMVNVAATTHLTLLILPEMRTRNAGHIINVGSVAGNLGAQGVALYGATKAFLSSFTRALYREMRGSGVHASLVQAGIVIGTQFYSTIASQPGALHIPAGTFGVTPGRVAERVSALIRKPRKAAYVPAIIRATALVEPLFGWALDLAGPLHLRSAAARAGQRGGTPRG